MDGLKERLSTFKLQLFCHQLNRFSLSKNSPFSNLLKIIRYIFFFNIFRTSLTSC